MFRKRQNLKEFDRESRPSPFQTMLPRSDFFAFLWNEFLWIALTFYGINSNITNLD